MATRLAEIRAQRGGHVEDFGIRGMDLATLAGYDAAVLIDALPRGERPRTLFVVEADLAQGGETSPEAHGMSPVAVLALARQLGPVPKRVLVVGCEPAAIPPPDSDDVVAVLSEPVRAARRGRPPGGGSGERLDRPTEGDPMKIGALFLLVVLAVILAILKSAEPELKRYMKIRENARECTGLA